MREKEEARQIYQAKDVIEDLKKRKPKSPWYSVITVNLTQSMSNTHQRQA